MRTAAILRGLPMEPLNQPKDESGVRRWTDLSKTQFRHRFRKGDLATVGIAGIGIAVIQILGRLIIENVLHLGAEAPFTLGTIALTLVLGLGLAWTMALMQVQH